MAIIWYTGYSYGPNPFAAKEAVMDASRDRQRTHRLYARIARLLDDLLDRRPLLAASLYEQASRCGKPSCKCARSEYRKR